MSDQTIVAVVGLTITGLTATVSLLLNFRAALEANRLARASRRTQAHQNLSEQEFALQQVLTECRSLQLLLTLNADRLGVAKDRAPAARL